MKSHTVQYERLQDRVVDTHRTSYQSGWSRELGELNPKPHLWIFISVSVGSSLRSKSLTSATVWIPVSKEKKSGRNLDEIGTAQLRSKSRRTHRFDGWTEALSCHWYRLSPQSYLYTSSSKLFLLLSVDILNIVWFIYDICLFLICVPQCKLPGHP